MIKYKTLNNKSFLVTVMLSLFAYSSFAQSGPGGIGNSTEIKLWLDASQLSLSNTDAVTTWNDNSGNNNTATQSNTNFKPTFNTNQINGFPAVNFDGFNDALNITSNITNTDITTFLVFSNSSTNVKTIFHTDSNIYISNPNSAGMGSFNGWKSNSISKPNNNFSIFSGTSSSITGLQTIASDNISLSATFNNQRNFDTTTLGAYYNVSNNSYIQHTKMLLAELVVYNEALNSAKRKIVSNYLALKYNLIGENNLYSFKTTYNHDVFGIGQESDGNQTTADNNGLLTISNPSAMGIGEFLLVGHDNAGTGNSVSVPTGIAQRLDQVWRVDKTGDVGTVDLTFSVASNNFAVNSSDYVLLIENVDGDFSNGGTTILETGRVYDGINQTVMFTGINLSSGAYLTLAEKTTSAINFGPGGEGNTSSKETWLDATKSKPSNNPFFD